MKEENIPINIAKNNILNETSSNMVQNFEIVNQEIKKQTKVDNLFLNRVRKKLKIKKDLNIKNKFPHQKDRGKKDIKTVQDNIKMNNTDDEQSNDIIKNIIFLIIIVLGIYFLVTKYLCVGFIKGNDNQIIEFNNQPNTLEVI